MTNFDKILKKGVESANAGPVPNKWEQSISLILHLLYQFNQIYSEDKSHHVAVKHISCSKCKVAGFMLLVRHRDNPKHLIKYHIREWKNIDSNKDEYLCDGCK